MTRLPWTADARRACRRARRTGAGKRISTAPDTSRSAISRRSISGSPRRTNAANSPSIRKPSLDAMQADLVGVSRQLAPAAPPTFRSRTKRIRAATCSANAASSKASLRWLTYRALKPLLESSSVLKIAQNAKFDWPAGAARN